MDEETAEFWALVVDMQVELFRQALHDHDVLSRAADLLDPPGERPDHEKEAP